MCVLTPSFFILSRQNSLRSKSRSRLGTSSCCWRALASDVVVRGFLSAFDLAVRILLLDLDKLLLEARWGGGAALSPPSTIEQMSSSEWNILLSLAFFAHDADHSLKVEAEPDGALRTCPFPSSEWGDLQFQSIQKNVCKLQKKTKSTKSFRFVFTKIKKHNFWKK